jgi:hypothetical protein
MFINIVKRVNCSTKLNRKNELCLNKMNNDIFCFIFLEGENSFFIRKLYKKIYKNIFINKI